MKRIVAYFYPPEYPAADLNRQRRIRLGVHICLAFVVLLVVFQPLYLIFIDSRGAGMLALPAIAVFLSLLFLLRGGKLSFSAFANVLIGISLVVHSINTCTTGGPMSIFIAGYIDMQIMTALLLDRTPALVWIGLQILVPFGLGFMEQQGVRFPYAHLDARSPQMQLLLSTAIIAGAAMFVIMMKTGLDSAMELLRDRNDELAVAYQNQIRVEKLAAELEQQHRIDALRQRIARDLHDDIGSALSAINIYSNIAERQGENSQPLLRKITESSGKLMEAMGDIVWSVHHSNDSLAMLLNRMREYAIALFEAQQIPVELEVDDQIPEDAIPTTSRKDFYLIYKEALNNISKHSGAQRVRIALGGSGGTTRLHIRDDGSGFDLLRARAEGNGLKNMLARATAIGASLQVNSAPGAGTSLYLTLQSDERAQQTAADSIVPQDLRG